VRIIAGEWRGRPIEAPPSLGTRPTADRVRETLFSMIASRIGNFGDLRVADLFAGSGALGLEALSRGAANATFVEADARAVAAIRRNAAKLDAGERVRIIEGSALHLPQSEPFDLIFADPPYSEGSGSAVILSVLSAGWLARGGWLSIETGRSDLVDPAGLQSDVSRAIGRARLTLLRLP